MVQIIDTPALARLLAHIGVEAFLAELADRIEGDYARWDEFEAMPRVPFHSKDGVIELMPIADSEWFSFKLVNGHPGNPAQGLQTVTAVGMLADVATGYPRLVCEMTVLTALRTAATSAVAARYLANRGASTLAIIGTGAQGEFQALAFKRCLGIRTIRFYDTDEAAMAKFAANLRKTGLQLIPCAGVAEAIAGAEIITTATAVRGARAVLTDSMVGPGVHINAIGGDCPGKTEIDPKLLSRARIVVEYLPQTRSEGEIQSLGRGAQVAELWEIIVGCAQGRSARQQVTIFDSVGFALEDYSTLRYVYDTARALGIGSTYPLIPQPRDPKDLFGYITELANCGTG
jgi:ornithine cyclodeaminase